MARIQILELPTEHHGDDMVAPFAVIIDQATPELFGEVETHTSVIESANTRFQYEVTLKTLAERIGARTVLVFEETIDIPANEVPLGPDGYPIRVHVEGEFEKFREQVQEEILAAQAKMMRAVQRASRLAAVEESTGRPAHPDATPDA